MTRCVHDWEQIERPRDAPYPWFRCKQCKVYGFVRARMHRRQKKPSSVVPYTCSENGCKQLAIARKTGRGPRGSYVWWCREHKRIFRNQSKTG